MSETKLTTPPSLAYRYKDALYLNITHLCPTACEFCIKFSWDYQYRSHNLLLKKDPSVEEVVAAVDDPAKYSEFVFCGYGESTYRVAEMKAITQALRARGGKRFRLNTIGLGNLINKRDIVPDLAQFLDVVSVSLNTPDPAHWAKIHRPLPEFRDAGFEGVKDFIRRSAAAIPETYVTAVDVPELDRAKFEALVASLGAKVRIRPYLDDYESD